MPEADGYVRIKATLDDAALTKKMTAVASQINRQIEALEKAKTKVAELEKEYQKLSAPRSDEEYKKGLEERLKAEQEIARQRREAQAEQDRIGNMLDRDPNNASLNAAFEAQQRNVSALTQKLKEAQAETAKFTAEWEKIKNQPADPEALERTKQKLEEARSHVSRLEVDLENSRQTMQSLETPAEKVNESIKKTSKSANGLTSYIGKLAKRMLLLYAFRRIFTYIRQSIMSISGLSVVTGVFTDFNNKIQQAYASNEQIQGSLARLRGALYTAFQPIYSAIVPALSSLINWLARGIQYIAAFFSALSGKSLGDSANGAKKLAKAVGGVGGAAKQANKQLASFDKLNTLSEDSGGGGGGGGGGDATDFGSLVDEGKLSAISAFAEKVKLIFKSLWDFIKNNFDFKGFWEDIKTVFRGVIDFLGGIFTQDWDRVFLGLAEIVSGLGGAVNKVLDFIGSILDTALGWLESLLVSFLNWVSQKTGYDLSGVVRIVQDVFATIRGYISSIIANIKTIIQGVVDFIAGVFTGDWRRAWLGITEIVRGAFNAVYNTVVYVVNQIINTLNSFLGFASSIINSLGGNANLRINLIPYRYASGGFPDTGSMFIAGEAGPELVGSFGSHNNSVINEAQLVQAFRQASSEQVALMQQQNSLLAALLDKELTFKPSSAAGKAFSQSIGMYNRAMGV